MEEDILYDFRNIVEESRIEDGTDYYIKLRNTLELLENTIKRSRELEEYIKRLDKLNARNFIFKSEIKEKIEELITDAEDVLDKGNYLDNFNGSKEEQKHYYRGYKDAALFILDLVEGE